MDVSLTHATDDERVDHPVLLDLATSMTYNDISRKHGWSRGRIYNLALRHGARKTEARIRERASERKARQELMLREMLGKTATADVLDYMDSLPDDCAHMLLTSCPYNVGKPYGDAIGADQLRHMFFLGWLLQCLSEASRVIRPGGVLFLQVGSTKDDAGNLIPMDTLLFEPLTKMGLTFQTRICWVIQHGLTPRRRLAERHETVLVFSKGPIRTFNATPARIPQKEPGKRAFKGENVGRLSGHPLGAFPSNVWQIPNIGHNNGEKTGHPCQFPLELAKRAVLVYSQPGDLIVDPFSGSGTTHQACIESGREFTGADLFYDDMRRARLAKALPDMVSELPGVSDESTAIWQAEARRVDTPGAALQLGLAL